MQILKIHINSFGNLTDFEITPNSDVNIITGENESGKSTLAAFIKFIFYGFPAKKGRDTSFSTAERYINWDDHSASGYMEILHRGIPYKIEREVYRSGKKTASDLKIINLNDNTPISATPDSFFLEGAPEEIFNKTVFISQIGGAVFDADSIHTCVENMLSGGDESLNTKKALSKLDSARISLLYKNEKGGKIYSHRRMIDELRDKKHSLEKQSAAIEELKTQTEALNEDIKKLKSELDGLTKNIDDLENAERLERIRHTKEAYESLKTKEKELELCKENATKNGFLPNPEYISKLSESIREYYRILEKMKDLSLIKDELKKNFENEQTKDTGKDIPLESIKNTILKSEEKIKKLQKLTKVFLSASAALGIILLVSIFLAPSFIPLTVSFFALSALFFFGIKCIIRKDQKECEKLLSKVGASDIDELERFKKNQEKMYQKRKDLAGKIGDTENSIKEQNELLGKTCEKFSALAQKYGETVKNISDFEDFKDKVSKIVDDLDKISHGIIRKKEELRLNAERFTEEEYLLLCQKTKGLALPHDIHSTIISQKLEKRNKERELENVFATLNEKKLLLTSLGAGFEDERTISEKEERLKSELDKMIFSHEAIVLAGEVLEKAMSASRDRIAPSLSELSSKFISDATSGKYTEVNVDTSLNLTYNSLGHTRAPEHLSEGTKDIVYLAFRVSLVSLLFPETPPIIIDEGFAGMDDERLHLTLSALIKRAKELSCQVFIFSPTKREALSGEKLGANIITMPKRA